jgi:hypothetical protein
LLLLNESTSTNPQALDQKSAMNEELCLKNEEGPPLNAADWDVLFQKLG